MGNSEGAEKHCREAIRLKPGFAPAHCNLGSVLLDRDKTNEAIPCFQEAIRLDGEYAEAYEFLGEALLKKGDREGAKQNFEKALSLDPGLTSARENLRKLARGEVEVI